MDKQWRCVKDLPFGYCKGEPEWEKRPTEIKIDSRSADGYLQFGTCKLDPKTCGKYLTHNQLNQPGELPKKEKTGAKR
jgi:hypothetical protein